MKIWMNGELCAADEARVSVFDHGFTVADGVFETLKIQDGSAFAVRRHLERLARSAQGMGLPAPDLEMIRSGIDEVVAANRAEISDLGRLRVTYTAGSGPLGSDRSQAGSGPTLVVAATPMTAWPESAAVITVSWPRNERSPLAGVKSTSYAENVIALAEARRQGVSEALMADTQGRLCEGTGSNVLVVMGDRIITPTLATGALPGITRSLVIEWCGVEEVDLPWESLADAEALMLTSSTRDVQPVHRIDGRDLPPLPEIARACVMEFRRRTSLDIDP